MEFTQAKKTAQNSTNARTESSGRIKIARQDYFSIKTFLFVTFLRMWLAENKSFLNLNAMNEI